MSDDEIASMARLSDLYKRKMGLSQLFEAIFPKKQQPTIPSEAIDVLVIGNHSSGKSSFINWCVRRNALATSVAIETCNFTYVVPGRTDDTLDTSATMRRFPKFKQLCRRFSDLSSRNLVNTRMVPAQRGRNDVFRLVNFIDTPGLIDGDEYEYDINSVVIDIAKNIANVVLVFLDPHIKSTCLRTVEVIRRLSAELGSEAKTLIVMSKMDDVPQEVARQRCLEQTVDRIARKVPSYKRLRIFPMYIPHKGEFLLGDPLAGGDGLEDLETLRENSPALRRRRDPDSPARKSYVPQIIRRETFEKIRIPNQIHAVTGRIAREVRSNVQRAVTDALSPIQKVEKAVRATLSADAAARFHNRSTYLAKWRFSMIGFLFILLLAFVLLTTFGVVALEPLQDVPVLSIVPALRRHLWVSLGLQPYQREIIGGSAGFLSFLAMVSWLWSRACLRYKPSLPVSQLDQWERRAKAIARIHGDYDELNERFFADKEGPRVAADDSDGDESAEGENYESSDRSNED